MKTRLLPGLLLAALLIGAQAAAVLHAFEHEPGAPQGKVCGTCVTAAQLAAGNVDTGAGEALEPARHSFFLAAQRSFDVAHATTVRQRGPPPLS